MQQRTWKRRNYFIKKDFQGKFIMRFFLTIFIGAVIFTAILSLFSAHTITISYEDSYLRVERTPKALFLEIVRAYGAYIFILGVVVSTLSLFLSHRIAGPLFRIEKSMDEVAKGNLAFHITLRRRDEAKELAEKVNAMVGVLSGRIREIREQTEIIHRQITDLSERSAEKNVAAEEARELISGAMRSVEDLKKSLSFFKIDKE